jgi:molybdopterin converting factor small subunit
VSDGVKDGDRVIVQPPANLADGDKVQIIPDSPSATP